MICLIDNYDSFTYNLVEAFRHAGEEVHVLLNDEWSIDEFVQKKDKIRGFVLGPGPGSPQEAQLCHELLKTFAPSKPFLGVCLGHQVICEHFGADVVTADRIMHGKVSRLQHDGKGLFQNIQKDIVVNRYHSLIVSEKTIPSSLIVSAWSEGADGQREVMGVRHSQWNIEGVQFHPESILTQDGIAMIQNFISWVDKTSANRF